MLKKIFAGLAGALALIAVPPTGEAERPLPIVLDLDHDEREVAPPPPRTERARLLPAALAWALDPRRQ